MCVRAHVTVRAREHMGTHVTVGAREHMGTHITVSVLVYGECSGLSGLARACTFVSAGRSGGGGLSVLMP